MRIKLMRRAVVTAVVASTAALTLGAAPAQAAPSGCQYGALCVYWNTGYGGAQSQFFGSNPSWGAYSIEDDDSSWFNNGTTGKGARIFDNRSHSGGSKCYDMGDGEGYAVAVDDRGSSNSWPLRC